MTQGREKASVSKRDSRHCGAKRVNSNPSLDSAYLITYNGSYLPSTSSQRVPDTYHIFHRPWSNSTVGVTAR
ncbi:hypothetical protein D3C73_1589110 [compost metagenome]